MNYELPIEQNKYIELKEVLRGNKTHCLFRLADSRYVDTLFIFTHGTNTGLIEIDNNQLTNEQVLLALLKRGVIKERGIKQIYTICCYGAMQVPTTIDGVTISSMHDSINEIHANVFSTIDDEYMLDIIV